MKPLSQGRCCSAAAVAHALPNLVMRSSSRILFGTFVAPTHHEAVLRRSYHIHSKYGDKVGSCFPEVRTFAPRLTVG